MDEGSKRERKERMVGLKNFMVWDHGKHKAKQISIAHINAFPNREEILKNIRDTGEHRGEFILITEYKAKERKRWS